MLNRGLYTICFTGSYLQHPYTELMLNSIPKLMGDGFHQRQSFDEMPNPINPPSGCPFRTRCPIAVDECANEIPPLRDIGEGHYLACHQR